MYGGVYQEIFIGHSRDFQIHTLQGFSKFSEVGHSKDSTGVSGDSWGWALQGLSESFTGILASWALWILRGFSPGIVRRFFGDSLGLDSQVILRGFSGVGLLKDSQGLGAGALQGF